MPSLPAAAQTVVENHALARIKNCMISFLRDIRSPANFSGAQEMRSMILALSLATLFAPSAFAQGTAEQRAACQDDAYKFCPYDVPDTEKVEACLRKYIRSISAACRAQFGK
jgi:hypothetical protein